MNTLTIDIGNNKIKSDVWDDNQLLTHRVSDTFSIALFENLINNYFVSGIIVSSVRRDCKHFITKLKAATRADVIMFDQQEVDKYKWAIKYEKGIGADRIAAFLGAESIFPNKTKLVVDAGTAITIDLVNKSGEFQGGNISLGLFSRMHALSAQTSLLPDIHDLSQAIDFGCNTISAIESGAINGVLGELIYSYNLANKIQPIDYMILTGGDAPEIKDRLQKNIKNIEFDPYLVGRGLNFHLRKTLTPN